MAKRLFTHTIKINQFCLKLNKT